MEESSKNDVFYSPTKGQLQLSDVILEIAGFVNEEPERFYRLVIGTDSQSKKINGEAEIDFVTAVVIHRKGKGGRYFWHKEKQKTRLALRDKIYTETLLSLDLAQRLVPQLRKILSPTKYDLEIHIDVGPVGPTREMIREVVGLVVGNGFVAKTKPESYGAFVVADRHT